MRNLYIVATYELNGSVEVVKVNTISTLFDFNMSCGIELEERGYRPIQFIITNNKEVYLRALLKARLMELKSYTKKANERMQEQMGFVSDEVLEETQRLTEEYEKILMKGVGSIVSRLLVRGLDVEDELALACYDYKQSLCARI